MDFWIQIGVTVLLELFRDKKSIGKFRAALRKLFMTMWANRLAFLTQADLETMGIRPTDSE